jgi:dTDP-4-dehydrorhamnose reductase
MKIAVTGAHGMLGTDVVKALNNEHEIIPFPPHAELELADFDKVHDFVLKNRPDVIVHLAAIRNPDIIEKDPALGWRSNFLSTFNLVRCLQEMDGVMCYGSTDSVFSGHDDEGPYHEFSLVHPLNIYGQTKYASEQIIRERMHKYFILRMPWLFGLGGRPEINQMLTVLKKARVGEKTLAGGDIWGSTLPTVDAGWAIGKIITTQYWGTYHLAEGPAVSRSSILRAMLQEAGLDAGLVEETNYVDSPKPARRAHYTVMTSVLLEPTFGIQLPTWRVALKEYIKELKKQGVI